MQKGGLRTKGIIKESSLNTPLITVITVVYNGATYLEQTMLSVLNQTYENIEYIIIDGASTDGTLDIIKKYEDKIDYWQSEPDKGVYDAMNKGIDFATGKWINFMNCGDSFYDINVIHSVFTMNSNECDVIYGNTNYIFDFGETIQPPTPLYPDKLNPKPFCHQSSFWKTCILKEKKFNLNYKIAADCDLSNEILKSGGKFNYVNILISNYECSSGISSKNVLKSTKEQYTIINLNNKTLKYLKLCIFITLKRIIKVFIPQKLLKKYRYKKMLQKSIRP